MLLILLSAFIALLFGEFSVRLFGLTSSNIIRLFDNKNKIYKSKPKIKGKYNKGYISGAFQINNEGWNSTHDYFKEKKKGTYRIACLGGSETEGLHVDVKNTYSKVLEDSLIVNGIVNEVYTFANMPITIIHGLHLARYVVKNFNPDILTVPITGTEISTINIHMKLLLDNCNNITEVKPTDRNIDPILGNIYFIFNILRQSRLLLYLNLKLGLMKKASKMRSIIGSWKNASNKKDSFTYTSLTTSQNDRNSKLATRYILEQYKKMIQETGSKIIFTFGPLHDNSFNWRLATDKIVEVNKRRADMKLLLEEYSLSYFDLADAFVSNYSLNKRKFDFLIDKHYNELGHSVIGEAIAQFLLKNNYFNKA